MNERARALFVDRESPDREVAYQALCGLFEMAEEAVEWAYEVWDELLDDLAHREGHKRAFAAQMLSRLAMSDPEGRMLEDFPKVAAVMKDEKTVTARHTLQSLWRVGLAGPEQKAMVQDALEERFRGCAGEKGGTLVRTDVITALGRLSKRTADETIEARVNALVEAESDEKQRRSSAPRGGRPSGSHRCDAAGDHVGDPGPTRARSGGSAMPCSWAAAALEDSTYGSVFRGDLPERPQPTSMPVPTPIDPGQPYVERLAPVLDHVRQNLRGDLSVGALARVVHFSPFHFHRVFTAVMGETVGTFVRRARLERAAQLMKTSPRRPLGGVALEVGFASLSAFSRTFRRHYGVAPSRWDRRIGLSFRAGGEAPTDAAGAMPHDLRSMIARDGGPPAEPQLCETPALRLAYVCIRRPFEPGALEWGYEKLREWLRRRSLAEAHLLGLSWDDVEVTPPDQIRYDFACSVPAGTSGGDGIAIRELPPLVVVAAPAVGGLARVARVWDQLYHEWLPQSPFEPYDLPPFELYRSWPDVLNPEAWDLDCCIPLKALDVA